MSDMILYYFFWESFRWNIEKFNFTHRSAYPLVRSIVTVEFTIAAPFCWNADIVSTLELLNWVALILRAVNLVSAIATVIVTIASPLFHYTSAIAAREFAGSTCLICLYHFFLSREKGKKITFVRNFISYYLCCFFLCVCIIQRFSCLARSHLRFVDVLTLVSLLFHFFAYFAALFATPFHMNVHAIDINRNKNDEIMLKVPFFSALLPATTNKIFIKICIICE